jgi:hypothetical protein
MNQFTVRDGCTEGLNDTEIYWFNLTYAHKSLVVSLRCKVYLMIIIGNTVTFIWFTAVC